MSGSTAGLVGAFVGLALGLFEYRIAGAIAERKVAAAADAAAPDQRAAFARQVAYVRRLLFWSTVMVFPLIGYAIGRSFGTS